MEKSKLIKSLWVLVPVLTAAVAMGIFSILPRDKVFVPEGAVEISVQDCYAQAGGTVESVLVKTGQQVRAGDVLARIDDRDLDSQAEQLRQTIEIQNARLEQLKTLPNPAALEASYQAALDEVTIRQENLPRPGVR